MNTQSVKFFLDSGDPAETRAAIKLLGKLDGQTTNPSLVVKHPEAQRRYEQGDKFTSDELMSFYKEIIQEISALIPEGSVSIEVYADEYTSDEDMFRQAQDMWTWIPNAHMKFPTTAAGLAAAEKAIAAGMRVNMTLCFTQQQAAAIYAATRGAKPGDVFVSPFIGRLDDIGQNGMDLIRNIVKMYAEGGDGHVQVLAASARNADHVGASIAAGSDLITAPLSVWEAWAEAGKPITDEGSRAAESALDAMAFETVSLDGSWQDYNLQHDLTDKGVERFANDWNAVIADEEIPQKQ